MTTSFRIDYRRIGFLILFLNVASVQAEPKYGPNATPLSKKSNLAYFQKSAAPDFWALIPFYSAQPTPRACTAAAMTLVMNGARSATNLTSDDRLLSIDRFVKEFTDAAYAEAVMSSALPLTPTAMAFRKNLTNQNVARLMVEAAEKLKIKEAKTEARLVNLDLKDIPASKKRLIADLTENEKSSDDFILFSYVQGDLTGDPEGGSHAAVVGGYDAKKKLVLILDPDREWYEPYWTPVDALFASIQNPRSDGIAPGYIVYRAR